MPQTRKGINPYRSDYEDIHSIQQSRIFTCRRRQQQQQQHSPSTIAQRREPEDSALSVVHRVQPDPEERCSHQDTRPSFAAQQPLAWRWSGRGAFISKENGGPGTPYNGGRIHSIGWKRPNQMVMDPLRTPPASGMDTLDQTHPIFQHSIQHAIQPTSTHQPCVRHPQHPHQLHTPCKCNQHTMSTRTTCTTPGF